MVGIVQLIQLEHRLLEVEVKVVHQISRLFNQMVQMLVLMELKDMVDRDLVHQEVTFLEVYNFKHHCLEYLEVLDLEVMEDRDLQM